eukprot:CAMPEP_0203893158 /NCGR_PEP_ID=MMETSP0359-20131031/36276_1 /ASSEMBLY_ACC=CAM_ASM_000338 /TAXON_ID=268821 /ORGANISM="Scrippsiella Hangoei, Strain SHTV-5" /LENGTH=490 /DNA_ID=CAMNT_0050815267 /DNA_START=134 /DNA_END=1603 /DNA_ORIENTATION=-
MEHVGRHRVLRSLFLVIAACALMCRLTSPCDEAGGRYFVPGAHRGRRPGAWMEGRRRIIAHGEAEADAAGSQPVRVSFPSFLAALRAKLVFQNETDKQAQTMAKPWHDAGFLGNISETSAELVEHVVAGYLSSWIYDTQSPGDPRPLQCGNRTIEFEVRDIIEDPVGGVSARLGAVTATFADGHRVLYFVFKGTSLLTDIIADACIIPTYRPFERAFQDKYTFVHQGAYHAIEQLSIRFSKRLVALLRAERGAGVRSLVVTGHSLGGMYAKTFLLETFLRTHPGSSVANAVFSPRGRIRKGVRNLWRRVTRGRDHEPCFADQTLVRSARCVTFGAPSICGIYPKDGVSFRRDLTDFMHDRAINYVHEDDPYARAWSHLNMTEMVGTIAALQLEQLSIPAFSRVVVRRASDFVLARLWKVLNGRDFQKQVLETAKQYREISQVRFLTRKPFRDWTKIDRFDGQHHRMPSYISCLRDATYAQGQPAFAFDEQ